MGEKYEWDILESIVDVVKTEALGDDGRILMKKSRFQTFKKKYDKYKEIYNKNKKHERFANWSFETQLLGYSYSENLRNVFAVKSGELADSLYFDALEGRQTMKFVGVVDDCFKRKSKNNNEYMKLMLSDEKGVVPCMMTNRRVRGPQGWRADNKLDQFIAENGGVPNKGNIVVAVGQKGDDILFLDRVSVMDRIIYMKLGDLK